MKKILKIATLASVAVITLSGCGIAKEFQPLPDEERYFYIDKVLSDIDYQNVGEIVSESRDENGGTFAPSSKSVGYRGTEVFDKIAKKLSNPEDPHVYTDCEYRETNTKMVCSYYGAYITLSKLSNGTHIEVRDSSNGRKSK